MLKFVRHSRGLHSTTNNNNNNNSSNRSISETDSTGLQQTARQGNRTRSPRSRDSRQDQNNVANVADKSQVTVLSQVSQHKTRHNPDTAIELIVNPLTSRRTATPPSAAIAACQQYTLSDDVIGFTVVRPSDVVYTVDRKYQQLCCRDSTSGSTERCGDVTTSRDDDVISTGSGDESPLIAPPSDFGDISAQQLMTSHGGEYDVTTSCVDEFSIRVDGHRKPITSREMIESMNSKDNSETMSPNRTFNHVTLCSPQINSNSCYINQRVSAVAVTSHQAADDVTSSSSSSFMSSFSSVSQRRTQQQQQCYGDVIDDVFSDRHGQVSVNCSDVMSVCSGGSRGMSVRCLNESRDLLSSHGTLDHHNHHHHHHHHHTCCCCCCQLSNTSTTSSSSNNTTRSSSSFSDDIDGQLVPDSCSSGIMSDEACLTASPGTSSSSSSSAFIYCALKKPETLTDRKCHLHSRRIVARRQPNVVTSHTHCTSGLSLEDDVVDEINDDLNYLGSKNHRENNSASMKYNECRSGDVANVSVRYESDRTIDRLRLERVLQSRKSLRTICSRLIKRPKTPNSNISFKSPMDSLSDYLLIRILQSGLDSDDLCHCSAVSRHWNDVVWNTPALWTSLSFSSPGVTSLIDVDAGLRCLTRRLSRATPRVCVGVESVSVTDSHSLTDQGLLAVARRCPQLRRLRLVDCCYVTNGGLVQVVSRCVSLQHLDVSGCVQISCISLNPTANIAAVTFGQQLSLESLDMSDCQQLNDNGLQLIATYCTTLHTLYLRRCSRVTDHGLQYLAVYGSRSLQHISLSECVHVTDCGVTQLTSRLRASLRYLGLARCQHVTDVTLFCLADYCPRLRYLNVRGCVGITGRGISRLASACHRLKALDLGDCPGVRDTGLESLAAGCCKLRRLSVQGCSAVSDVGIAAVGGTCRQLRQLNVQDCPLVGATGLARVTTNCPHCVIEHSNLAYY